MWNAAGFITWLALIFVCILETSAEEKPVAIHYSVLENRSEGFYVGNIPKDTNILQNQTIEEVASVRYSFYTDTVITGYFVIDEVTGNLTTSDKKLDREQHCEFLDVCNISFEVSVRGRTFFGIPYVTITVIDENDNPPAIINAVNKLEINEKETVGTYFRLGEAFDTDRPGNNTIQDFDLQQPEKYFKIDIDQNGDRYTFGVHLVKTLDHEVTAIFQIRVVITDGGSPALTSVHEVTVHVIDANDNSPRFDQSVYEITIDETIALQTTFLTLSAQDADSGDNGRLTYSIRNRQPNFDAIRRLFSVDVNNGAVSVISALTHESAEYYEFIVDASDNGDIPKTNSTIVKVTVNDVENIAPSIEINLFNQGNIGFVDIIENPPIDFFVAHVTVVDNDKGDNGQFSCNVTDGLFALEKFQGRGFKVVVNGVLDREVKPIHNITVLCHDHGTPPKMSSKYFEVRVLDINDNDPVFLSTIYNASMKENTTTDKVVTRVTAKDNDLGRNGSVEYFLEVPDSRFHINNSTGVISVEQSLDREVQELIVFTVLAADHGNPRRTGTATVSFTLIDVNDNAPVIIPARPEFWISENMDANIVIGTLNADDKDKGDSGRFTFAMAPIETDLPFEVFPNGVIRATESLNREQHSRYDIPVTVTDMGPVSLSNTQSVTIYVTDVNDNVPIVTFPNTLNDTVSFLYQPDIYNVVTTVSAYDTDHGANGTLIFSIFAGNDEGIFEIDQNLGEISVIKFIDIKKDTSVTLEILVKDKGVPQRSTRCSLNIELIYTNGTGAQKTPDDVGNNYVIISVVVIVTTVAVAIAIIGVIVFLRKQDEKKAHDDVCARYSDSGISSGTDSSPPETEYTEADGKTKKEAPYSTQYPLGDGLDGGRNVESTTEEYYQNRFYDPAAVGQVSSAAPTLSQQKQERIDSHMKALKLQQYLWEAKTRQWENSHVPVAPLEDSESETSRETNTYDSGRGGSEDDVSTSSPITDEKNFFNVAEPRVQKRVSFVSDHYPGLRLTQSPVRESTPIHPNHAPPRPPSYLHSNHQDLPVHSHPRTVNQSRLAIKNFTNTSQHVPNNPANSHNGQTSNSNHKPLDFHHRHSFQNGEFQNWRDAHKYSNGGLPVRMRHDSGSSFRSNEDDGGSTTTSGSYTLDQVELDVTDYYGNKMDLVV